jgi:tetrahydromethanopterin S-methyltransferase subunit B
MLVMPENGLRLGFTTVNTFPDRLGFFLIAGFAQQANIFFLYASTPG